MVGEVVKSQKVSLGEVTEFYVVNLLSEFAAAEKLFNNEPLAVLYHKALQQERDEKIRTLRQLGDVSLYTAGFFRRVRSKDQRRRAPTTTSRWAATRTRRSRSCSQKRLEASSIGVLGACTQKFTALTSVLEEDRRARRCNDGAGPGSRLRVVHARGQRAPGACAARGRHAAQGAAAELMLLDRIQVHLEAIYGTRCELKVTDFLVGEQAISALGGDGEGRESLFVREDDDALQLKLFHRARRRARAVGAGVAAERGLVGPARFLRGTRRGVAFSVPVSNGRARSPASSDVLSSSRRRPRSTSSRQARC